MFPNEILIDLRCVGWISICLLPENPEVCSVVTVGSSREARRSGMAATWLGGRGPLRWPTPCALLLRPSAANATTPTARSINQSSPSHPIIINPRREIQKAKKVCVWVDIPSQVLFFVSFYITSGMHQTQKGTKLTSVCWLDFK